MTIPKTKRSGGPKTTQGKLAVSGNALKTGAYSNITVLPGEDQAEYAALEEQLHQDFQPADLAEAAMVREIASLIWKKLRLERLEYNALSKSILRPISQLEMSQEYRGPEHPDSLWLINQIDRANPQWELQAKRMKEQAMKAKALDPQQIEVDQLKQEMPEVFEQVQSLANEYKIKDLQTVIRSGQITDESGQKIPVLELAIRRLLNKADLIQWAYDNREEIRKACRVVKEDRLLTFMTASTVRRAHDDLSRAFYKALAELRKHQEWRRRLPIDVTPDSA